MSEIETPTTPRLDALEANAAAQAANDAPPAAAGEETTPPPEEPQVAAASPAEEPGGPQKLAANRANAYHYQPQGPMEAVLIAKISIEYMRYRRLVEREQGFYDLYRGFHPDALNKVTRYQTAINRQLFEAMKELERVQAKREAEEHEEESDDGESADASD